MQPDEPCPECGARLHHRSAQDDELYCQECGGGWRISDLQDGSAYREARARKPVPAKD